LYSRGRRTIDEVRSLHFMDCNEVHSSSPRHNASKVHLFNVVDQYVVICGAKVCISSYDNHELEWFVPSDLHLHMHLWHDNKFSYLLSFSDPFVRTVGVSHGSADNDPNSSADNDPDSDTFDHSNCCPNEYPFVYTESATDDSDRETVRNSLNNADFDSH
jgi:hypothetical protein